MKKIFSMLLIAAALCMVVAACGDNKDEPVVPEAQKLESEHSAANDTYLVYDIDLSKDSIEHPRRCSLQRRQVRQSVHLCWHQHHSIPDHGQHPHSVPDLARQ